MTPEDSADGSDARELTTTGRDGFAESVEAAIRYPTESDDVVRTVAIGGLLSLLSFLVVPIFALSGYFVEVLDRTASGNDVPPAFEDWGALIVTGLKAVVIGFVYLLVPTVLGGIVVAGSGLGIGLAGEGPAAGLGALGVLVGGLLWLALSLVVAYLLPAALANFAERRRIGAGFDFGTLKPVWLSRTYARGWIAMVVVALIGGIVTSVLNVVPLLGSIVAAFVGFYFGIAAYAVIGRTWAEVSIPPRHDRGSVDERAGV